MKFCKSILPARRSNLCSTIFLAMLESLRKAWLLISSLSTKDFILWTLLLGKTWFRLLSMIFHYLFDADLRVEISPAMSGSLFFTFFPGFKDRTVSNVAMGLTEQLYTFYVPWPKMSTSGSFHSVWICGSWLELDPWDHMLTWTSGETTTRLIPSLCSLTARIVESLDSNALDPPATGNILWGQCHVSCNRYPLHWRYGHDLIASLTLRYDPGIHLTSCHQYITTDTGSLSWHIHHGECLWIIPLWPEQLSKSEIIVGSFSPNLSWLLFHTNICSFHWALFMLQDLSWQNDCQDFWNRMCHLEQSQIRQLLIWCIIWRVIPKDWSR